MSKNWDKPLSRSDANSARELNPHHGTNFKYGHEWRKLVGAGEDGDFYEHYLTYCKLMDSPLGRALA